jgi:hypothetical protein
MIQDKKRVRYAFPLPNGWATIIWYDDYYWKLCATIMIHKKNHYGCT